MGTVEKELFDIYVEFESREVARGVLEGFAWQRPELVCGYDSDPNPKVVKLSVTTLDPRVIRRLAESLSCTLITRDHVQLFPQTAAHAA